MKIKGIIDYDIVNYKLPCLTIMMPSCSFKCDKECGRPVCQNSGLAQEPDITISVEKLIDNYYNPPAAALCFQGLEPFDSFTDLYECISYFRVHHKDPIIIYTGYNKEEITDYLTTLKIFDKIIIKYGRYIYGEKPHQDEVLGVELSSSNQYAEELKWEN
jgi:hypothetical protein